jgi:hypothetical protein
MNEGNTFYFYSHRRYRFYNKSGGEMMGKMGMMGQGMTTRETDV